MNQFRRFLAAVTGVPAHPLLPHLATLTAPLAAWQPHGDWLAWQRIIQQLPDLSPSVTDCLTRVQAGCPEDAASGQRKHLESLLKRLMPWKKGPFDLFGIHIDCEWRSDWKWQRVLPHLSSLTGRRVLDVGCGSGYHLWRMWGAGAAEVIGIDPGSLFFAQFLAVQRYLPADAPVHYLPLTLEQMPATSAFDTVFSMGVLYHRRAPIDHLQELFQQLRPGGELILETLVIDGDEHCVLTPDDRYARMANVWFIPSVLAAQRWLVRAGFTRIRVVDEGWTSTNEQRSTAWCAGESLTDFLDRDNPQLTVEGLPAPKRAILIAERPQ